MVHADPRQEVIRTLSRFLTSSFQSQSEHVGETRRRDIDAQQLEETVEEFHFLREKTLEDIPGRMILAATNEQRAGDELLICYLEQNARGEWRYSGGASSSRGGVSSTARVILGGGGWPKHFHAGGYVVEVGREIARVSLVAKNGTVVEDVPEHGIVLFFTDRQIEIPLQAELYDRAGNLVARHNVFS